MGWFRDLALWQYLRRRTRKKRTTICKRRTDGSLWAASSPQCIGFAMRGLFSDAPGWHFARVRIWRGIPIVSPRVFWTFSEWGKFDIVQEQPAFWLKAWPYDVEYRMLDRLARKEAND